MKKYKLPNLIIPGFQKPATSSLSDILSNHPDIYCGETKETHYFSKNRKYSLGVDEYKLYYQNYNGEKWVVDGSQSYMPCKMVANKNLTYKNNLFENVFKMKYLIKPFINKDLKKALKGIEEKYFMKKVRNKFERDIYNKLLELYIDEIEVTEKLINLDLTKIKKYR